MRTEILHEVAFGGIPAISLFHCLWYSTDSNITICITIFGWVYILFATSLGIFHFKLSHDVPIKEYYNFECLLRKVPQTPQNSKNSTLRLDLKF